MNKYIFYYEVIWYSDTEEPEKFDQGFLMADNYAEAAAIIDQTYEVLNMTLKMIGDGPVIKIPNTIDDFDVVEWEEANGF